MVSFCTVATKHKTNSHSQILWTIPNCFIIILRLFPPTLLGARVQACPFLLTPAESFRHRPDGELLGLSTGALMHVLVDLGAQVTSVLFAGACAVFSLLDVMSYSPFFLLQGPFFFSYLHHLLFLTLTLANKQFTSLFCFLPPHQSPFCYTCIQIWCFQNLYSGNVGLVGYCSYSCQGTASFLRLHPKTPYSYMFHIGNTFKIIIYLFHTVTKANYSNSAFIPLPTSNQSK